MTVKSAKEPNLRNETFLAISTLIKPSRSRNRGLGDDAEDGLETMPPSCSLRQTDLGVAADMGARPAWSLAYPERDASQLRQ